MDRQVFDLDTGKIMLRAIDMSDELSLSARLDDADSDRAIAFEIGSVLALAALVTVESMTKEDAIAGFSRFYDHVSKVYDRSKETKAGE